MLTSELMCFLVITLQTTIVIWVSHTRQSDVCLNKAEISIPAAVVSITKTFSAWCGGGHWKRASYHYFWIFKQLDSIHKAIICQSSECLISVVTASPLTHCAIKIYFVQWATLTLIVAWLALTFFTDRPFLPAHFFFSELNGKGSSVDKSQPLVISLCTPAELAWRSCECFLKMKHGSCALWSPTSVLPSFT